MTIRAALRQLTDCFFLSSSQIEKKQFTCKACLGCALIDALLVRSPEGLCCVLREQEGRHHAFGEQAGRSPCCGLHASGLGNKIVVNL